GAPPRRHQVLMAGELGAVVPWVREHAALGTIGATLAGAASYVGNLYYDSYYAFYLIDSGLIGVPTGRAVSVFVVVFVMSASLVALMVRSHSGHPISRVTALRENIPLFVLLFLLTAFAIDIYWNNVETLSSWLNGLLREQ